MRESATGCPADPHLLRRWAGAAGQALGQETLTGGGGKAGVGAAQAKGGSWPLPFPHISWASPHHPSTTGSISSVISVASRLLVKVWNGALCPGWGALKQTWGQAGASLKMAEDVLLLEHRFASGFCSVPCRGRRGGRG